MAAIYDDAPDDAEFEPPHPIFRLAEENDNLRKQLAEVRAAHGDAVRVPRELAEFCLHMIGRSPDRAAELRALLSAKGREQDLPVSQFLEGVCELESK